MKKNRPKEVVVTPKPKRRRWLKIGLAIAGVATGLIFIPTSTGKLKPRPRPCTGYEDAVARFEKIFKPQDDDSVMPETYSLLLTHGHKTENSIVLIHGITSTPHQFERFGRQLHAQGYNVVIPRMPYHGFKDRERGDLKLITAEKLREYADNAVDIARGLGENVSVVGLSGGGVVAGWLAQFRHDVRRAVLIAPALGVIARTFVNRPLMNLTLRLPNYYIRRSPENIKISSPYVLLKQSSRATAEFMRLGLAIFREAHKRAPLTGHVVLVVNPADTVINNPLIYRLGKLWQRHNADKVSFYEFAAEENLPHDLLDPYRVGARPDFVYPVLERLVVPPSTIAAKTQ
jgi:esterase/lipase